MSTVASREATSHPQLQTSTSNYMQPCNRNGQCRNCGRTTHRGAGSFWNKKTFEPLTIRKEIVMKDDDDQANDRQPPSSFYIVYKGYCLEPTCYTLQQAKELVAKERKSHNKYKKPEQPMLSRRHSSQPAAASRGKHSTENGRQQQREPRRSRTTGHCPVAATALIPSRSQGYLSRRLSWVSSSNGPSAAMTTTSPPVTCLFGVDDIIIDNPNEICRVMRNHGDDAQVCRLGMNHLRTALAAKQGTTEVMLEDEWVLLILNKIQQYGDRLDIVNKAIIVLLLLVGSHKKRIIQEGGISAMSKVLLSYPTQTAIQERVCKLLEQLLPGASCLEDELVVALVKSLVRVIQSCTSPTRTAALLVLWHITQMDAGSKQFKSEVVSFKSLLCIAMDGATNKHLRQAVMHLISLILEASYEREPGQPLATEEIIARLTQKWAIWDSPSLVKTALDIITQSFSEAGHAPKETTTWLSCAEVALASMRICNSHESIQVAAMRAIAQLLNENRAHGPLAAILHSGSAISLVQTAMASFPQSTRATVGGWGILSALRDTGDTSIPNIPMIRIFRGQVLQESGLDHATKKAIADIFTKICTSVVDQTVINDSGILIDIDKASRTSQDPRSTLLYLRLFLTFLSIAQTVKTRRLKSGLSPAKTYGTKIVNRVLQQLLERRSDETQSTQETLKLLGEVYIALLGQDDPTRIVAFDVGRATIAVKTHAPVEASVLGDLMYEMKDQPASQEACCLLISTFFAKHLIQPPFSAIETTHAISVFLSKIQDCMLHHKNDERVVIMATYAWIVVSKIDRHQKREGMDFSFAGHVVQAISLHQQSRGLKLLACSYFEIILSSGVAYDTLLDTDTLSCIIQLTADRSESVALRACHTVSSILNMCPGAASVLTSSDALVAALIMAMENHLNNRDIVHFLCIFTQHLFESSSRHYQLMFANCGGLNALLYCLGTACEDTEATTVQALAELLLMTMEYTDGELILAHRLQVSYSLVRALEKVICNKGLSRKLMETMLALCTQHEFFQFVFSAAVPALHDLMSTHFDDIGVSLHATRLVRIATSADSSLRLAEGRQGHLVQLLVNIMLAHRTSSDLLVEILDILRLLETDSSFDKDLHEQECVAAIVAAARANQHRSDLLGSAFAAINNVVSFKRDIMLTPMKGEIFQALLDAMSQHPVAECVQSRGLMLLKSYASDRESTEIMKRRMDELFPILYSASTNCSPECVASAEYIMRHVERN